MSVQIAAFAFGCLLLMVAILGGGFEVKELKVPKVGRASRLSACLFGGLFVFLGIGPPLSAIWPVLSPSAEETVAPAVQPTVEETPGPEQPVATPAPPPSTVGRRIGGQGSLPPHKDDHRVPWEQKPRQWLRRIKGTLK